MKFHRPLVLCFTCALGLFVAVCGLNGEAKVSLFDEKGPTTLNSGSEDYRNFSGGAVVLRLKSSPVFGAQPADWPVVQVGALALAFIQQDGKGRIGVLRGTEASMLAEEFPLGVDGRATAPFEIVLGCDPVNGTLVYAVGARAVAVSGADTTSPVEVSLAAGASAPWEIVDIEVLVIGQEAGHSSAENPDNLPAETTTKSKLLGKALETLRPVAAAGAGISASKVTSTSATTAQSLPADYVPLEIATPPAVRRTASEIRASLAQSTHP